MKSFCFLQMRPAVHRNLRLPVLDKQESLAGRPLRSELGLILQPLNKLSASEFITCYLQLFGPRLAPHLYGLRSRFARSLAHER